MKAKFQINLGHHKNFTALSNMPMIASEPMYVENIIILLITVGHCQDTYIGVNSIFSGGSTDWVLDKFNESIPMSTYLVAFTINDFVYRESKTSVDGIVFRVWARPDAISQLEYATEIGPKVLQYFEKTFRMKYPLPKMDMIAIPNFGAGAMENFGQ